MFIIDYEHHYPWINIISKKQKIPLLYFLMQLVTIFPFYEVSYFSNRL